MAQVNTVKISKHRTSVNKKKLQIEDVEGNHAQHLIKNVKNVTETDIYKKLCKSTQTNTQNVQRRLEGRRLFINKLKGSRR